MSRSQLAPPSPHAVRVNSPSTSTKFGSRLRTSIMATSLPLDNAWMDTTNGILDPNVTHAYQFNGTLLMNGLQSDGVEWWTTSAKIRIMLYALIFVLSVLGNALVIATLVQNKRMRTVTNLFLLNLAISDLLLGVFCMPFTLVGTLLREFIFGEAMCKAIPYLQAVSVSVSAWTLVAISLERYFAICQPLTSRRWQTLSHAYKMIFAVWIGSLFFMLPIVVLSQLIVVKNSGKLKCREVWPSSKSEKAYTVFLDGILLVLPLVAMAVAYALVARTLWKGMRSDARNGLTGGCLIPTSKEQRLLLSNAFCGYSQSHSPERRNHLHYRDGMSVNGRGCLYPKREFRSLIRTHNLERTLAAKKKVIVMLFILVLEFFVCWTPLYVVNTLALIMPRTIYGSLGSVGISLIQLVAYISSCCNPITYCFLHGKFRKAFLGIFGCRNRSRWKSSRSSEASENETSFYCSRLTDATID